jgi:hypothetical protein
VALTAEQKDKLVEELEVAKATKAKGFRSSARTRINDVTTTLGVLENEVHFDIVYNNNNLFTDILP